MTSSILERYEHEARAGITLIREYVAEAREVVESFEGEDSYRQTVANSQYFLVNDSPAFLLPNCG